MAQFTALTSRVKIMNNKKQNNSANLKYSCLKDNNNNSLIFNNKLRQKTL